MSDSELAALVASKVMGWPEGIALTGKYPRDIGCRPPTTLHAFYRDAPSKEQWATCGYGCDWCWMLYDDPVHDNSLPYGEPVKSYPYTFHGTVFYAEHGSGERWAPHERIDQAWQVVEHMHSYWSFDCGDDAFSGEWQACFLRIEEGSRRAGHGRADTAPLAICRAALAAVGATS
jgi:Phage ABA sandwich domain